MHEVKIVRKHHVICRMSDLMWRLSRKFFYYRKYNEAYKHTQIKEWPDAKNPSNIKIGYMNAASVFPFLNQKISDQKSAKHKEKVNAKIPMLKQSLDIIKCVWTFIFDIVEESHVGVIKKHQEERNKS